MFVTGKNHGVIHLQYLFELGKFPLANKLLLKDYNLKAASAACSSGLNAQNSSEEKKSEKKKLEMLR